MTTTQLTFDVLVRLEPRLLDLVQEAALVRNDAPNFCANEVWSEKLKPRLMQLVGFYAEKNHSDLHNHVAYEIAYDVVYQALPDCRDCLCRVGVAGLLGEDYQ